MQHHLKLHKMWSPMQHADGRVPWFHSGERTSVRNEHPERYGTPADGPAVEETFRPRLTNTRTARVREGRVGLRA